MALFPVADELPAAVDYGSSIALTNNQDVYVAFSGDSYCLTYDKREAGDHHIFIPAGGMGIIEKHPSFSRVYVPHTANIRWVSERIAPLPVRGIEVYRRPEMQGYSAKITYMNDATLTTVSTPSPVAALDAAREELIRLGHA